MRLSGVQLTSADEAAGPAHPGELARDDLVARRELDTEYGQHPVEARVGEGQVLGVTLDPVDRDVVIGRPAGGRSRGAPA